MFQIWLSSELNKRGLSHQQAAELFGVSRGYVSNVLRGAIPASCEFVLAVASALQVEPVSLLKLAGLVERTDGGEVIDPAAEVAEWLRELPPERFEIAREFVRFLRGK